VADQHVQTASQPGEHIPSFLCTRVRELKTHPRSMRGARFTQSLVHSLTHLLWSHCWHLRTSVLPRPLCAHLHRHTRLAHNTFWRGTATAWRGQVRSRFRVAPVDHFATTKVRADCFSLGLLLNLRQTSCMHVCVLGASWRRVRAACVELMVIALRFVAHALHAHAAHYCLTTGTHERQTRQDFLQRGRRSRSVRVRGRVSLASATCGRHPPQ
jgi:hypothetical protein